AVGVAGLGFAGADCRLARLVLYGVFGFGGRARSSARGSASHRLLVRRRRVLHQKSVLAARAVDLLADHPRIPDRHERLAARARLLETCASRHKSFSITGNRRAVATGLRAGIRRLSILIARAPRMPREFTAHSAKMAPSACPA